jgi:hypothetical protein
MIFIFWDIYLYEEIIAFDLSNFYLVPRLFYGYHACSLGCQHWLHVRRGKNIFLLSRNDLV